MSFFNNSNTTAFIYGQLININDIYDRVDINLLIDKINFNIKKIEILTILNKIFTPIIPNNPNTENNIVKPYIFNKYIIITDLKKTDEFIIINNEIINSHDFIKFYLNTKISFENILILNSKIFFNYEVCDEL